MRSLSPFTVFDRPGKHGKLQIIDFGASEIVEPSKIYNDTVGTLHYLSPESLSPRSADDLKKSDLWALGVIAYILLYGRPPFTGSSPQGIFRSISRNLTTQRLFRQQQSLQHTAACKDFLGHLLCAKESRMSAESALHHKWIQGKVASDSNLMTDSSAYIHSLKEYQYGNKLQHILVNAILNESYGLFHPVISLVI